MATGMSLGPMEPRPAVFDWVNVHMSQDSIYRAAKSVSIPLNCRSAVKAPTANSGHCHRTPNPGPAFHATAGLGLGECDRHIYGPQCIWDFCSVLGLDLGQADKGLPAMACQCRGNSNSKPRIQANGHAHVACAVYSSWPQMALSNGPCNGHCLKPIAPETLVVPDLLGLLFK